MLNIHIARDCRLRSLTRAATRHIEGGAQPSASSAAVVRRRACAPRPIAASRHRRGRALRPPSRSRCRRGRLAGQNGRNREGRARSEPYVAATNDPCSPVRHPTAHAQVGDTEHLVSHPRGVDRESAVSATGIQCQRTPVGVGVFPRRPLIQRKRSVTSGSPCRNSARQPRRIRTRISRIARSYHAILTGSPLRLGVTQRAKLPECPAPIRLLAIRPISKVAHRLNASFHAHSAGHP